MDKVDPTSWITLGDLANQIGWASLERNCVEHVRPVLFDRSGSCRVFTDLETYSVEQLIQCACVSGDDRDRFDDETRAAEAYTDVAFYAIALVEWLRQHDLRVPKEWRHYQHAEAEAECTSALSYEQLKTLTGRRTPADVKAWLASKGIPFHTGQRNRPFTMVAAMEQSLGVNATAASNDRDQTKRPKRKIVL